MSKKGKSEFKLNEEDRVVLGLLSGVGNYIGLEADIVRFLIILIAVSNPVRVTVMYLLIGVLVKVLEKDTETSSTKESYYEPETEDDEDQEDEIIIDFEGFEEDETFEYVEDEEVAEEVEEEEIEIDLPEIEIDDSGEISE